MKMRETDQSRQPLHPEKPAAEVAFSNTAGANSFKGRAGIQEHMAGIVTKIGKEAQSGAPRRSASRPTHIPPTVSPHPAETTPAALPAANQFSINGNSEGIVFSIPWFMISDDMTQFQNYWDGLGNMVYASKPRPEPGYFNIAEETTEEIDFDPQRVDLNPTNEQRE